MQDQVAEPTTEYSGDRLLDDLRTHLAHHDKPVAFLFGAGTSCAVKVPDPNNFGQTKPLIPDIKELTKICKKKVEGLGGEYKEAWEKIEEKDVNKESHSDVEYMLSRLTIMLDVLENSSEEETLVGLNAVNLKEIKQEIRKTIADKANPKEEEISKELPHNKFARWLINTKRTHPIEIFTVNYDTLIERALEAEGVPVFDGFVGSHKPFFYPDSLQKEEFAPGSNWTRLWKMHGSISWQRESKGRYVRIVRKEINDSSGEMILPSFQKYDDSRQQPYISFSDKLTKFLKKDNALLITIGFSFRDSHIHELIFNALKNRPTTNVYSLQYEENSNESILSIRSEERKNLTVVYPNSIIISGKRKKLNWDSINSHDIDIEKNPSHVTDFNIFCNFIEKIITYKAESHEIESHEVTSR